MDVHPPKNGINRYWSIPISTIGPTKISTTRLRCLRKNVLQFEMRLNVMPKFVSGCLKWIITSTNLRKFRKTDRARALYCIHLYTYQNLGCFSPKLQGSSLRFPIGISISRPWLAQSSWTPATPWPTIATPTALYQSDSGLALGRPRNGPTLGGFQKMGGYRGTSIAGWFISWKILWKFRWFLWVPPF